MKRLCAAIITILVLFSWTTAAASFLPQRTVRVAISPFPNFTVLNSDGTYSGIIIDYIDEIKKYTGWNVEYIYTDPTTAINLLDDGQADLMGPMNKNAQTLAFYDFAELSSGYSYSTITAKKSAINYIPNDYDTFKNIKIAVFTRATSRVEAFQQFCTSNGLQVTPVYFDDPVEWEKAFATGAVDAQLSCSAKLRDDEKIIANFKQEPYFFGVAKGNTDVLRELNHALGQINQINPHFDSNLYMKYFGEHSDGEFSMTSEEKRFVQEHPVLRITAAPDWRPISYTDSTNQFCGINADMMELIRQKTGFQFVYVPAESFHQAVTFVETNQADLLVGAAKDGLGREHTNLAHSLPYLPLQTVVLYQRGKNPQELENPVMASVYEFEYDLFEPRSHQYYDTATEAIEAVKAGKCDFTVVSSLAANQYFLNNGKSKVTLVPISSMMVNLSIALKNPADPTLFSILDRAIYSISDAQRQAVIFENTSMQHNITFRGFIYANPIQAIWATLFIGLLVLLLLFLFMNMRLRLSRKAALISDTYRTIGELSDEYIFAYDFETKQLSLPERFATLAGSALLLRREDCQSMGLQQLILAFENGSHQPNFTLEFPCQLADGTSELFRAISMVICDNIGRPVRGIGKLVSIQAEFDEKQQLEKMANTDALTGLYSKSYCEQWAEGILETDGILGALLLIDIDNFKEANDTLGHLGGDEALKSFSNLLKTVFAGDGVLGRWGGDEFIVLIDSAIDRASIEEKAQTLCARANHAFPYQGATFHLSISVGIALSDGTGLFRDVFQAADTALYEIKRAGKNGYRFA